MPHFKKRLGLIALGLICATAAQAQSWTNSGAYNGYGATTQNTASNYSLRDPNGNLTLVNGQFQSSTYSANTGGQYSASTAGGVGMSGAGTAYGQATAIGNQLNVVVLGSHNTTVVDTTQINNGNQTAVADLNGH